MGRIINLHVNLCCLLSLVAISEMQAIGNDLYKKLRRKIPSQRLRSVTNDWIHIQFGTIVVHVFSHSHQIESYLNGIMHISFFFFNSPRFSMRSEHNIGIHMESQPFKMRCIQRPMWQSDRERERERTSYRAFAVTPWSFFKSKCSKHFGSVLDVGVYASGSFNWWKVHQAHCCNWLHTHLATLSVTLLAIFRPKITTNHTKKSFKCVQLKLLLFTCPVS